MMQDRQNIEVLFLGNITHETDPQALTPEKSTYQDQISFQDPVQVQLIRIPNNGKELYSRLVSQTQKQPIKSLQIYYRNLDKKLARYSLLVCSSSELLVSSTIDILITLKQTVLTDLLVIKGNFSSVCFCVYGRVLRGKEEIERRCPYFGGNMEVLLKEEKPSIKINRNIFDQSRSMVKAIEDEYSQQAIAIPASQSPSSLLVQEKQGNNTGTQKIGPTPVAALVTVAVTGMTATTTPVYNQYGYSNDRQIYDSQINNICKLSQQLLAFEDLNHIQQKGVVEIRGKIESIQSNLSKLFKSARIGLYYPTPYRASTIAEAIPITIVKIAIRLLPQSLSDQYRALEVLKLIVQLKPHAQYFVTLGGIEGLIRLFLVFFSSELVILSSLKCLIVQVFIALSFWEFSARKMVEPNPPLFDELLDKVNSQVEEEEQQQNGSVSRSKSRSRDKKKKRSDQSQSKSSEGDRKKNKKDKKSKKNKDKSKSRDREREKSKKRQQQKQKQKQKLKKQQQKQKQQPPTSKKQSQPQPQSQKPEQQPNKPSLAECSSFYQIIFKILQVEKNSKLQQLLRVLIEQITQTLTKNVEVSNQMAYYTPLLRDTKYMFSQGGEMINSKTLKTFASFQPFLNQQQSRGVDSPFVCESQKIRNPKKSGISPKLFKLLDSALTTLQSRVGDQVPLQFDQQFMTLMSALIETNKNGIAIGLNSFVQAIRVDKLLLLKKQQAIIAILCQYIHQVFIQQNGMNLIFYLDQIHNSMLKIINWLKEDKTFSIEIKRKVQYLINSALIYNHFSGTENNFKSFSEYFVKLIGHESLDINKILDYNRKEYHKTVNPLSYTNLSENFSMGNFYDVLPAQPLLEVDICLKVFLAILKLNKNIWTVFYEYKFVPAFATLYLKLHSLLKFFLTPSLQRQNAIIDLKMHDRLVSNYLQTAKHLTSIFICKWKYESAFNELTEEDDIFDTVELYEKWIDTYLFLEGALHSQGGLTCGEKTMEKIKDLLGNFVKLFDTIFKGYQLTKNLDRLRNIKALIKFLYRQHYETLQFRSGILSLLTLFIHLAGPNTTEVLSSALFDKDKSQKNGKDNYDILLPDNERSIFENLFRRNVYRSEQWVAKNLVMLVQEMLGRDGLREKVYEVLEVVMDQNQAHLSEEINEMHETSFIKQKTMLFFNMLAFVKQPMNLKIEQHALRLLKVCAQQNRIQNQDLNKVRLINSLISFFANAMAVNSQFSGQLFQQFIKCVSSMLRIQGKSENKDIRIAELRSVLLILQALVSASSSLHLQSILLYGDYIEKPFKPNCELSLENILNYFREGRSKQMLDQTESILLQQIGITIGYLLCKLTSIDGKQFFSTQSRKNAINYLISSGKNFTLNDVISFMDETIPQKVISTLKNYLDFPIVEKSQTLNSQNSQQEQQEKKTAGAIYSRGVFTLISENDPVGRTRFELVQQRWQGGSTQGPIYKVNTPLDYQKVVSQQITNKILPIEQFIKANRFQLAYTGIHPQKQVNNLFSFKIRKMFAQDAKKNALSASSTILMKPIPAELKRPETISKEIYQGKVNVSPSLNRIGSGTSGSGQVQNIGLGGNSGTRPVYQQPSVAQNPGSGNTNNPMRASSSNNREPSPFNNTKGPISGSSSTGQPYYGGQNPQGYPLGNQPPTTISPGNPPYYMPTKTPQPMFLTPVSKPYGQSVVYEQPATMHTYYPSNPTHNHNPYDPRTVASYPPTYPPAQTGYPPRGVMPHPGMGYPPTYIPPVNTTGGYAPQRPAVTQVRQAQQEMSTEAINILLFLQQNPNAPEKQQLKARVNKLFVAPGVHPRVMRYFQELKRGGV